MGGFGNDRGEGRLEPGLERVVIADDHPLFLHALRATLEDEGIEVVGTAHTGHAVLELVAEHEPDAVLLDLSMPEMDGLTCLQQLRERHPYVQVVVVSSDEEPATIQQALDAGAVCFIGKTAAPEDIGHALRLLTSPPTVHYRAREITLGAPTPLRSRNRGELHELTKRELEILKLVAEGHSNSAMARLLWVTEQTIKFHLSNVYRKLDVANRTQAAAKAYSCGLVDALEDDSAGARPRLQADGLRH